jgi:hypothetical protein
MVKLGQPEAHRNVVPVAGELRYGKGTIIISQLKATERIHHELPAAAYFQAIINRAAGSARRG